MFEKVSRPLQWHSNFFFGGGGGGGGGHLHIYIIHVYIYVTRFAKTCLYTRINYFLIYL